MDIAPRKDLQISPVCYGAKTVNEKRFYLDRFYKSMGVLIGSYWHTGARKSEVLRSTPGRTTSILKSVGCDSGRGRIEPAKCRMKNYG